MIFTWGRTFQTPGGIEMRSGRMGSIEFILRGCMSRCGDPLDIAVEAKVTWGISYEPDKQ